MDIKKQDELIKKEVARLNEILDDLPDTKLDIVKELIDRAAFMTIQLKILEVTIKEKGPTYEFINGSQRMLIESPAQK